MTAFTRAAPRTHAATNPASTYRWFRLLVLVGAIAMALSFLKWNDLARYPRVLAPGQHAPEFAAEMFGDAAFHRSDFAGHPLVLLFYDQPCDASVAGALNADRVARERPEVVFVAINGRALSLADSLTFRSLVQEQLFSRNGGAGLVHFWQVRNDPSGKIARLYHVPPVYPFWYFIDAHGTVVATRVGEHVNNNLELVVDDLFPRPATATQGSD